MLVVSYYESGKLPGLRKLVGLAVLERGDRASEELPVALFLPGASPGFTEVRCNDLPIDPQTGKRGVLVDRFVPLRAVTGWVDAMIARKPEEIPAPVLPNQFFVTEIHKDWYMDEVDFSDKDSLGEALWRLDFSRDDNEYQAQLFLTTAVSEEEYFKFGNFKAVPYRSARLFIERDNRLMLDNDRPRIDYACDCWNLPEPNAIALLAAGKEQAVALMVDLVEGVSAMPNDRAFIRANANGDKLAVIEAYWAGLDAPRKS